MRHTSGDVKISYQLVLEALDGVCSVYDVGLQEVEEYLAPLGEALKGKIYGFYRNCPTMSGRTKNRSPQDYHVSNNTAMEKDFFSLWRMC